MIQSVPPSGPEWAEIALVGEAPGDQEVLQGAPFVGASGNLLKRWWLELGLDPWTIYKDNVVQIRPPQKKIELIPKNELESHWIPALLERLKKLKNVKVVVPTGNVACNALLRNSTKAPLESGILQLRGGVFPLSLGNRNVWCVPVVHPAWFLHGGPASMGKQGMARADWKRVLEIASQGHSLLNREVLKEPTSEDLAYFASRMTGKLAVDIETMGDEIQCVGFSCSPDLAVVFPLWTATQREKYRSTVIGLLEGPEEKIFHNGHYDTYWLKWKLGVDVKNWKWDTMWMHHALDPAEQHSLQFLASIYAKDYRPWKKEFQNEDEKDAGIHVRDPRLLWEYNGFDCCYTREIFDRIQGELEGRGSLDFYFRHYSRFFSHLLSTMLHGVRVDTTAQLRVRDQLAEENQRIRAELKRIAGYELYAVEGKTRWREPTEEEKRELWKPGKQGNLVFDRERARELGFARATRGGLIGEKEEILKKDFSGKKLQKFFYEDRSLKKQYRISKTKEGKKRSVSVDETALKKLATTYPQKAGRAVKLILQHRENKGEYDDLNKKWDADGRIRCQYSYNTEAGRFSSKSNPRRTGRNLQNVKRGPQRRTYLPDEGCVFLLIDGSQVEDRVTKMFTGSPRLAKMANLRPEEFDAHRYNASRIFGVLEGEVTPGQRALGKMAVHAAQRGMAGKTLADRLLTEAGMAKTPAECQKMIDAYLEDHWEIRDWYFPMVRKEVIEKKELWNTWGRVWRCHNAVLDEDLYRRAYSFLPQSECNDLMIQAGYLPALALIGDGKLKTRVNLLVHDEIILSCPSAEIWEVAKHLVESLERVRFYPSGPLRVPMNVSVGASWGEKHEFGRFPSKEEMLEKVRELENGGSDGKNCDQ